MSEGSSQLTPPLAPKQSSGGGTEPPKSSTHNDRSPIEQDRLNAAGAKFFGTRGSILDRLNSSVSQLGEDNDDEAENAESDLYNQRQAQRRQQMAQYAQQDAQIRNLMKNEGVSFEKNALDHTHAVAEDAGKKYGNELQARIKTGDFSSFFLALIVALVADVLAGVEVAGDGGSFLMSLVGVFIDGVMFALLMGQGTWFKKQIVVRLIWPLIAGAVMEALPFLDIIPTYTILVLWMEINALKELRKNKGALKLLLENMSGSAKRKGQEAAKISSAQNNINQRQKESNQLQGEAENSDQDETTKPESQSTEPPKAVPEAA